MDYKEKFFEGADFQKNDFRALMPKYYPAKYKKYIEEETKLLKKTIKGANRILEAGVGIGRLVPILSPLVKEFIGIDNAKLMLRRAKESAKDFSNTKIVYGNLEEIEKIYPKNYFDYSLCVWNTLGNVKKEDQILKKLAKVTSGDIIISVYKKGTIKDRENWYKTVGIKIKKIDLKNEVFYSFSGLKSKSYSVEDIKKIAEKARLRIKRVINLNGVVLYFELSKLSQ